jgi:hypothetical protein
VEEWLKKNNDIPYEETSALDGSNVEVSFNRIAQQLLKQALTSDQLILYLFLPIFTQLADLRSSWMELELKDSTSTKIISSKKEKVVHAAEANHFINNSL